MWDEREQSESGQRSRWRDVEFYFGDTWKATRTLTLDYGIRWSFMPAAWLADNKLAAFVPSAYDPNLSVPTSPCNGIVLAAGAPNGCAALGVAGGVYSKNRSIIPSNNHLIAPRVVSRGTYSPWNWVLARGSWAVLHSRSDQRHEHPAGRRESAIHDRHRG